MSNIKAKNNNDMPFGLFLFIVVGVVLLFVFCSIKEKWHQCPESHWGHDWKKEQFEWSGYITPIGILYSRDVRGKTFHTTERRYRWTCKNCGFIKESEFEDEYD